MSPGGGEFLLAVDARDLASDHRGLGRYARAVLRELCKRNDLGLVLLARGFLPLRRNDFVRTLQSTNFRVSSHIPKNADAAWHPWNGIFFKGNTTHVATIADVAPFRFPVAEGRKREHEQRPFREAAQRADRIITLSAASARDVENYLQAESARIAVTYPGVDELFTPGTPHALPPRLQSPTRYFLFVGDPREARKNFATLYDAFRRAWPAADGPVLAVLCRDDPALRGVVHVPIERDEVLLSLYRGAIATCVPALYEGFGMPVVESMACGTPVLAADASSIPEAAGDAALLLAPADSEVWRTALVNIAADANLRAQLRARGIAQAEKFSWTACAEATLTACRIALHRERASASAVRSSTS